MSHWNHRVIRRVDKNGNVTFGIHEVFYSPKTKKPDMWTESPVEILGDTIEDVREYLDWMIKSLDTPILTERKNMFGKEKLIEWKTE